MKPESFEGIGHGIPVKGHVLISTKKHESKVIPETEWRNKLNKPCKHGYRGWSCKECI